MISKFQPPAPDFVNQINIFMDKQGGVGVNSNCTNLCTIFGMLEMAKKAYIEAGLKPKSELHIPAPSLIHPN